MLQLKSIFLVLDSETSPKGQAENRIKAITEVLFIANDSNQLFQIDMLHCLLIDGLEANAR